MNCPRCDGLAVREYNIQRPVGYPFGICEWRCLNCGMVSDDIIRTNQAAPPAQKMSRPQGPRQLPRRAQLSSPRR